MKTLEKIEKELDSIRTITPHMGCEIHPGYEKRYYWLVTAKELLSKAECEDAIRRQWEKLNKETMEIDAAAFEKYVDTKMRQQYKSRNGYSKKKASMAYYDYLLAD